MQKLLLLLLVFGLLQATAQSPIRDTTRKDTARMLKTITITGSKSPIERRLDRTVVNLDQNPAIAGATVLEALQHLPGVQVTPDGQVSINGKAGVNVYIDGKPTYLSAADLAALLSSMAAADIQRIEIMTNPSARYDASGTAGIINIVKKKNHKTGFNGTINGSFIQGYYARYNAGFTGSYKNDKVNLFFSDTYTDNKTLFGRNVTSDIQDINGRLLTKQASANKTITIRRTDRPTAGIDWYASARSTLSLSATGGITTASDATLSGLDETSTQYIPATHENFTSNTHDHPYNYTTTFQWVQQLDTLGRAFTVDLDYSNFTNHPVQTNQGALFDTSHNFLSETGALLTQHRGLHIYSAQADYTRPMKNGRWEGGLKSSYVKINNDNSYYDEVNGVDLFDSAQSDYSLNTEQINAAYATFEHDYKKLEAKAGIRVEQATIIGKDNWKRTTLTQRYFQLFPTLFLNYKPDASNAILLRLGRRTERPDYSEEIPFRRPLTPTLFFQGNPNLRPDLSWHGEGGYTWKNTLTITAGVDIDHDYLRTIPYIDQGDTTITRRPTNVQAQSWNIDLTFTKQLAKGWSADNTLSLFRNSFAGGANGYWNRAPGRVAVYLGISNHFLIDHRLSVELDGEYDGGHQLITSWFGPYYLVNIAVKRTFGKGRGSLTLVAHNLLQSEDHDVIDKYQGLYQYSSVHYYTRYVSLNVQYRFGSGKLTRMTTRSSSQEEQQRAGSN
ncbi:outer membrane beta-barrel protein [Puia dinghuensis]|uniref:TonB-dependent receptor n=1 Tax=Puia dinghuensis TaxID=1792502 RepID=A0A8J2UCD4_9BACT|nr:outer membrane beta-barrel protein [Puia dinghuensis]GGA98193.1 TonB-dependent receptor [Puia dinghuensis]